MFKSLHRVSHDRKLILHILSEEVFVKSEVRDTVMLILRMKGVMNFLIF
jgi:hypothetical protein